MGWKKKARERLTEKLEGANSKPLKRVWFLNQMNVIASKPIVKRSRRYVYIPRSATDRRWRLSRVDLEAFGMTYSPRLHTFVYASRKHLEAMLQRALKKAK